MPKVVAKFECKLCGDIFEAISGSYSECKCGKNCVDPSRFSTSYKNDNGRGHNFKRLEDKTYFFADEYFILQDELLEQWNMIKEFKFEGYKPNMYIYEMKDKSADGNEYIHKIIAEVSTYNRDNETNEVRFSAELKPTLNKDKLLNRMKSFYDLLNRVKNNELNLNDRGLLEELCAGWDRTQQDVYDYKFYI